MEPTCIGSQGYLFSSAGDGSSPPLLVLPFFYHLAKWKKGEAFRLLLSARAGLTPSSQVHPGNGMLQEHGPGSSPGAQGRENFTHLSL